MNSDAKIEVAGNHSHAIAKTNAVVPAMLAILFGAFLIYGVALAEPSAIHNAAHDGRHSFALPCH